MKVIIMKVKKYWKLLQVGYTLSKFQKKEEKAKNIEFSSFALESVLASEMADMFFRSTTHLPPHAAAISLYEGKIFIAFIVRISSLFVSD